MGLPQYHEQPVLLLMYRTMENLDFIDRHKSHSGPFEVTQLINSFLAAIAHPWDQLLDQEKLEDVPLSSRTFRECGFPTFPALPVTGNPAPMHSAYDPLRVLRNGAAHGNLELLDHKGLRNIRQTGPLPRVGEKEIAGIKLWNSQTAQAPTSWCAALDVHGMRQCLEGMMRLCEKRSLWQDSVRMEQDRRDGERESRRAG